MKPLYIILDDFGAVSTPGNTLGMGNPGVDGDFISEPMGKLDGVVKNKKRNGRISKGKKG